MSHEMFVIGKVYNSIDEVKAAVLTFNQQNFTRFIITSNNKKSLVVQCTHGRQRKSKSCGIRPNQKYNFLGCKATIKVYKSQKAKDLRITHVDLSHNHPVGKDFYETQYSSAVKQRLMSTNMASEVKDVVKIPSQAMADTTNSQDDEANYFPGFPETMMMGDGTQILKVEPDDVQNNAEQQSSVTSNSLVSDKVDASRDIVEPVASNQDDGDSVTMKELNRDKKYNLVMPKLTEIANLISSSSTTQFFQYLEELDSVERRIRQGKRIIGTNLDGNSSDDGLENVRILSVCGNTSPET